MTYDEFADATCILPDIVADGVTDNPTVAAALVDRLLTVCAHNPPFYAKCKRQTGRDMVYAFMRHWHDGILRSPPIPRP